VNRLKTRTHENLDDYARVIVKKKTWYEETHIQEVRLLLNLPPKHPGDRCAMCGKLMPIDYPNEQVWVDDKVDDASTIEVKYDGTYRLKGYGPVCSTTCAVRFTKAAYKAGYRIVR